jgi:hypothetical protein
MTSHEPSGDPIAGRDLSDGYTQAGALAASDAAGTGGGTP